MGRCSRRMAVVVLGLTCAAPLHAVAETPTIMAEARPTAPAQNAGDAAAREAIVARLLDLGNSRAHVDSWRRMLAEQAADVGADLDSSLRERVRAAWSSAVGVGFDVNSVVASWRQRLAAETSLPDLEAQLAFETSPLGQRLNAISAAAAEEHLSTDESARRIVAAQKSLERDPARANMLRRVVVAADIEATTVDVISSLQLAAAIGAIEATPAGKPRAELADVMALSERFRTDIKATISGTLPASYAHLWSTVSTRDLEIYARHLEQPATRRVVKASAAIYNDLMRGAALDIGRSFAREMHSERL